MPGMYLKLKTQTINTYRSSIFRNVKFLFDGFYSFFQLAIMLNCNVLYDIYCLILPRIGGKMKSSDILCQKELRHEVACDE